MTSDRASRKASGGHRPPLQEFVFFQNGAFVPAHHGSSQTQNFENAAAHTQGVAPLAGPSVEQMHPVRKHSCFAYRLPLLRLLQGPAGAERRRLVLEPGSLIPAAMLRQTGVTGPGYHGGDEFFVLHSHPEIRKIPLR
jgi:hypothetical protein